MNALFDTRSPLAILRDLVAAIASYVQFWLSLQLNPFDDWFA